jgi:hypothetical protein
MHRYQSIGDPLTELRLRMRQLAQTRIRYGYRKIRVLLERGQEATAGVVHERPDFNKPAETPYECHGLILSVTEVSCEVSYEA